MNARLALRKIWSLLACLTGVWTGSAQTSTALVNGQVFLEDAPAIGAHVKLRPANVIATVGASGTFTFEQVPYGKYTLTVSYIGAAPYRQPIYVDQPQMEADIELKPSAALLSEAIVTGQSASTHQESQAIQIESVELSQLEGRVKDLSEAIEQLPGVNVRTSGSFGDRADISINGLSGTAVRTYLDGLPLEFIYPQLSITNLPVEQISRVDVYKGVLPIDVGTDALGGGINIITRQQPYNEFKASYGYGSFNTHQANAHFNYKLSEGVVISADATYNYSDNNYRMRAYVWEAREEQEIERFHDAYRLGFGSATLDVRGKPWADKFRIGVSYIDYYKELQNGGAITQLAFGGATYRGNAMAASAVYEKRLSPKWQLSSTASLSRNNVLFVDTTANIYSWSGAVINRNPNMRGELSNNTLSDRDFNNIAHRATLDWAVSERGRLQLSNLLAYQHTTGRDETRPLEQDFLQKDQYLTKNILGLEYQHKLLGERLTLALAGKWYTFVIRGFERRSATEVTRQEGMPGYYATAKFDLWRGFFLRASYESAIRIPTFFQYFGNGANLLPNVELSPETSDNFNLGLSYTHSEGRWRYGTSLNGFLRKQNDIIYRTTEVFQQFRNAEEVETLGVEGDCFAEFRQRLRLQFNITRLRQVYESIAANNPSAQFLVGTDFPNVPKFFTNTRLSYEFPTLFEKDDPLQLYVQHKFVDEFNFINAAQTYDPANYVPEQHRIDAGVAYTFWQRKLRISANVNNLLDADIFDNFSIPRPGRNCNMKLTYTFRNL